MQADSVIFDLDGTLWDNTSNEVRSFSEMIGTIRPPVTLEEVRGFLGLQLPQIGKILFPMLESSEATKLMRKCCDHECELVRQYGGKIYGGVEKMLQTLSSKMPLFIVSNCQVGYIEAFLAYHGYSEYFIDTMCAGTSGFTKGENIKRVITRNHLKKPVYVGDTQGDCDAAGVAGIPFIFASYGFGSVERYDAVINAPAELVSLL